MLIYREKTEKVFPTCVGVFLSGLTKLSSAISLPHVRGGVSKTCSWIRICLASSPRAWGCFCRRVKEAHPRPVFPTCVGVFLGGASPGWSRICLPHVRGGVSFPPSRRIQTTLSSPRAWGCFRHQEERGPSRQRLPHVRGGVSSSATNKTPKIKSSPRAWGCFQRRRRKRAYQGVFPTCVGVFLRMTPPPV